jgi:hypothetical protein
MGNRLTIHPPNRKWDGMGQFSQPGNHPKLAQETWSGQFLQELQ